MEALDKLMSVLCDQEGNVCISGSDKDREIIQQSLTALRAQVEELKGKLKEAEKFCGDAVMVVGEFTHMDPEDYMREGLDIRQMENALNDFLDGVEQQLESRATRAETRVEKLEREVKRFLPLVNAVTAPHRHGQPMRKGALDNLSNGQLDLEAALAECEEGK